MKKFTPTFDNFLRICDFNGCHETKTQEYYNDNSHKLKFCNKHYLHPYGDMSDIIPIFDKDNYRIFDDMGKRLCEFVGCMIHTDLKFFHKGYWCEEHGRIIFGLRHKALGRSDRSTTLSDKLKEFTYRKVYDEILCNDILGLEKELGIKTELNMNLNTNLIHYEYSYKNYLYIKNKEEKISLFKKTNKEYFDTLFKNTIKI